MISWKLMEKNLKPFSIKINFNDTVMYRALQVLMNWLIDVNYAFVGKEERGAHVSSQGMVQ